MGAPAPVPCNVLSTVWTAGGRGEWQVVLAYGNVEVRGGLIQV